MSNGKKCICNVRMARFDSDAIQRFEAAIALALLCL